jgi:hypothetical protein
VKPIRLFEVKFLLEPESVFVRAGDGLEELVLKAGSPLGDSPKIRPMRVSFVDSVDQRLRRAGWSVRVRQDLEGSKKQKVSYKRRYRVAGPSEEDLDAAMQEATEDLQEDLGGGQFELDWSRTRRTLSVGLRGREGAAGDLREAALEELPAVLEAEREMLSQAREYGPVAALRWSATNGAVGQELEVELWRLPAPGGGQREVLEVSFETPEVDAAASSRDALLEEIDRSGWRLAEVDVLKTELLFEAFGDSRA